MSRTLIDSSSWVHYLRRRGDRAVRARVSDLLARGEAVWCPVVRLELWNGVGSATDRKILRDFESWIPDLAIGDQVWDQSCSLAERCRKAGQTAPASDVLIAACARHHRVGLEHSDAHFDFLLTL
ncbi:MAG TPA: PIN domain-containing protein [Chthoniobacterales bacterium]|nr:PIN domain-containing protein [Chthoniobacterales bacterium]